VSLCAASISPRGVAPQCGTYLACRMVTQRVVASCLVCCHVVRYTDEHSDLLNGVHGLVYLDTQQPRVCIRGPEVRVTQPYAMPHPRQHWAHRLPHLHWGCPFERARCTAVRTLQP